MSLQYLKPKSCIADNLLNAIKGGTMSSQPELVRHSAGTSLFPFLPLFVFCVSHLLASIPIFAAVLQLPICLSVCSPLPMDIYCAGFLDDSQDGALSREHSLRLIWVSAHCSPGGTKREQNR